MRCFVAKMFLCLVVFFSFSIALFGMNDEEIFYSKCSSCHGTGIITNKKLTKKEWEKKVKKMKSYGANLSSSDIKIITEYLFLNYGK